MRQLDLFAAPTLRAPQTEPRTSDLRSPAPEPRPPVFVRHPRARRYVVRVKSDGTVRVTIPRRGSRREAEEFVVKQRAWIERQLRRVAAEPSRPERSLDEAKLLLRLAKETLPPRLLALAAQFDLRVSKISIRNQQWRWGSCSPNGHICLNWRLVTMPDWVCDYVLIHELMHLKRMDHSKKFWKLVAAACPDYERARAWLRTEGRRS